MKATCCDKRVSRAQKLVSVVLAVLVAMVAVFPLSASAAASPVVSPMFEPQPVTTGLNHKYYFVSQRTDRSTTQLWEYSISFSSEPSTIFFRTAYSGGGYGCYPCSDIPFSLSVSCFDVLTGNLISSSSSYTSVQGAFEIPSTYYTCTGSYILYDVYKKATNLGFYSLPSGITQYINIAEPFVTWAVDVPDQVQYKSSLPTPQWDIHNRYIVIDDKLFWISYYIDNLWINPITGSATVSSDDHTAVVTGNASDPNDGDLYYNYNISIRYQDKDYYCLQYNSVNYSNESMCAPCLVYTSSGSRLTISFDQLSGIYSSIADILVDYRIYCSSFDLITGEYIESIYSANGQQGNAEININIDCPDEISSVYCYGVDFVNAQNLPVNLASVIWSYDLEFASWRSDISSKLDAIYALLSQSSIPTTIAPKDYGSAVSEVSDLPTYNASDVAGVLNSAVSDVNANLSSGIEWGQGWFARIYHDIPELFIVVVLALAFGLTLLILGKKKSDS